ncbi:MAG TPA: hypothetical protein VJ719_05115 [Chthoniobacterales bacterium]|nr:hypothetical protein [Chthoniobacterales bacterium]
MPNESMRLIRKRAAIAVSLTIMGVITAPAARSETIYYAVSPGDSFEQQTWHSADRKTFETSRPANVFDLYTVHRLADGSSKVIREMSTPSGDWFLHLTYRYGKDGRLTRIDFDFRTFNGICPCGETGPVRCQRSYAVDTSGRIRKDSELVTHLNTGNTIDWTFDEPKVRHWAKLSDLPIKPR